MAKEGPNWDGLLKWSIANSDGTRPTRDLRYFFRFVFSLFLSYVFYFDKLKELVFGC